MSIVNELRSMAGALRAWPDRQGHIEALHKCGCALGELADRLETGLLTEVAEATSSLEDAVRRNDPSMSSHFLERYELEGRVKRVATRLREALP